MKTRVLFEDASVLVAEKPQGMPVMPDAMGQENLLALLQPKGKTYHVINRLDAPTGGIVLLAKTADAAEFLSACISSRQNMEKQYLCTLEKPIFPLEGRMDDYLYHDSVLNKSRIVSASQKGAKKAILSYSTLVSADNGMTLVKVTLETGRTHQIRAQFSSRGYALAGDKKYGSKVKGNMGLWAYRMVFPHPVTHKEITIISKPPVESYPWNTIPIDDEIIL